MRWVGSPLRRCPGAHPRRPRLPTPPAAAGRRGNYLTSSNYPHRQGVMILLKTDREGPRTGAGLPSSPRAEEQPLPLSRVMGLASLTIISLMVLVRPAYGVQSNPSVFEFIEKKQESGPFVGYMRTDVGRFGYGPKGGLLVGGRWGVELGGPISLEGVAGIVRGERDVVDPGRDEGDRIIGQAPTLITTVDARLKFSLVGARTWRSINPFLVFGGGMAFDLEGADDLDERLLAADQFEFGSGFFGTLGVGTRAFLTRNIAARVDGLFSLWGLETPPGFSEPERGFEAVESSEWASGLSIGLSLMYRW